MLTQVPPVVVPLPNILSDLETKEDRIEVVDREIEDSRFAFLYPVAPDVFTRSILEVTHAEPDVGRQVLYVLSHYVEASLAQNSVTGYALALTDRFNVLKGHVLRAPEDLVDHGVLGVMERKTPTSLFKML